jgi:iron complex outermembrane receptor protein
LAYEVGEKADFLDHKLRVNVAAFYSDYRHRIVAAGGLDCLNIPGTNTPISPCIVIPKTNYVNSPGKIYGEEVELAFKPVDSFLFTANLGQTRFTASGANAGITPNGEPGYVPEWNAAVSGQYTYTFPNGSTLSPRYDVYLQTQICTSTASAVYSALSSCTGGYTLHNVRLEYATQERTWTAAVGVENLANHFYYLNKFDLTAFGEPTVEGQPGQPRTWYLTLRRNFK